ncbi:hypothetical protein KKH15_01870 [Patescibacteria group bacterium]|nr:hypothetical protein [Patescibacteria group bacterium]MBU1754928.1 hypothetical protein [Patescibacteria group bacterium]
MDAIGFNSLAYGTAFALLIVPGVVTCQIVVALNFREIGRGCFSVLLFVTLFVFVAGVLIYLVSLVASNTLVRNGLPGNLWIHIAIGVVSTLIGILAGALCNKKTEENPTVTK